MAGDSEEMDFVCSLPINSETLLKLTIPWIKLLRYQREIQIKQMRREIANLLETGQEATFKIRVEHIIRQEKMMAAQEMVELFCKLIIVHLPIIEAQRECPLDLKEAISSVCFAAPRCSDLPELLPVQMLFASEYGKAFMPSATELMPECGVNWQLVELLSIQAPTPDVKLKLLKEIAEEHELNWDPSASEIELLETHEDLLIWPDDIIWEILLRLPVKTLLLFKCVCKHWHALIGSLSFINQHYGHESNQAHLLIRHRSPTSYALYVDETFSGYEEPDHLQMPLEFFDLMGPLNGVYLVVIGYVRVALLNPAMRQFKPLPLLHPNVQRDLYLSDELLGFGLNPMNGDYKVVSIRYFFPEVDAMPLFTTQVVILGDYLMMRIW